MKLLYAIRFSVVLTLAVLVAAQARSEAGRLPRIAHYALEREGDSLRVEFTAELPARFLRSSEAYVMIPVLTTPQGDRTLPALSVEGGHYYLAAPGRDLAAEHVRCTRDTLTAVYRRTIPATAELSRAGLRVDAVYRTLCPCDKGREAGSEVLIAGIPDLSAYAGRTQILYYIPADYAEAGTYAHDFGGRSVFPPNGSTVDRNVFDPAMQEVIAGCERIKNDIAVAIRSIRIEVASSPDGPYAYNKYLADARAESVRTRLREGFPDADGPIVSVTAEAENWEAFRLALPASDIGDKAAVERILRQNDDLDAREAALRALPEWPAVYRIFNRSRNCRIVLSYDVRKRHPHRCATTENGLVETRLNAPCGYITAQEAARIASIDGRAAHLNNRMVACMESGDDAAALACAGQISDEELCPVIAGNKAVLYSLTGDGQRAESYFRLAAGVPATDYNRGVAALNAGNEAEAAELLAPYTDKN